MDTGPKDLIRRERNNLTLCDDPVVTVSESVSVNGIIERNSLVFTRPFVCLVDGVVRMRSGWDDPLPAWSVVHFVELPHGGGGGSNPIRIIALLAVAALSFWLGGPAGLLAAKIGATAASIVGGVVGLGGSMLVNYFLGNSAAAAQQVENDYGDFTAYSLSTGNQLAPGVPVPEHFGRIRFFPPLVQAMYTKFFENGYMGSDGRWVHRYKQNLYMLGVIGMGEYVVHNIYIGDTPLADYQNNTSDGISFTILPPGSWPSYVTRLCWVSDEVSGQELDSEWPVYAANPPGTTVTTIQFDITFPSGLGQWDKQGNEIPYTVGVYCDIRGIEEDGSVYETSGVPDDWTRMYARSFKASTTTPLAFSCGFNVPYSRPRYEVRIMRSPYKVKNQVSPTIADTINLTALKAFGGKNYTAANPIADCTMVEVVLQASEKLSGNAASQIRVDATRKLYPVMATGLSDTLEASTSPADAFAHIALTTNGGNLPAATLDFDALAELRSVWNSRGDTFNYRFVSRTSVMEALAKVAMCGRAVPFMPGGKLSLVRDSVQEVPAQIYTDDDISEGSLVITHNLRTSEESTCVEIQYVDPDSWETRSVFCYDEDGSEENPFTKSLDGCTDMDHAYREGMYMYLDDKLNRSVVEFVTGLKGHIPSPGEKILVASRSVDWAQTGIVMRIDGNDLYLSEPARFVGVSSGEIMLSTPDGGASGPHAVTPGTLIHCVVGDWSGLDIRTFEDDGEEATKWMFGASVSEMIPVRVLRIVPLSENEIRIVGSTVDDSIYLEPSGPAIPGPIGDWGDLLMDVSLNYQGLSESDEYQYLVTWTGGASQVRIELDEGSGYTILQDAYGLTYLSFTADAEDIDVRVTPYDGGVLSSADAIVVSGSVLPAPTGLVLSENAGDSVTFDWDAVTDADAYGIELTYSEYEDVTNDALETLTTDESATVQIVDEQTLSRLVAENSLTVSSDEMVESGGPWNELSVSLVAISEEGVESKDATLSVNLLAPVAPDNFTLVDVLPTGVILAWSDVTSATGYKVKHSTTEGFDPSTEGTVRYSGTQIFCTINGLNMSGSYEHYFRVAATNEFYSSVADLNWSGEVAALPDDYLEDVTDDSSETVTTNTYDTVQIVT